MKLRGKQAGLGPVSPHVLRRSYATQPLRDGHDLAIVADLLGHARVNTTRIYDRWGADEAKAASATLAVSYAEVAT